MCTVIRRIARKIAKWAEEASMEDADVLAFLRCPHAELVDFAVGLANLTRKEAAVVRLCGRLKYTQFEAAEELVCSEDAVQQWYKAAKYKLKMAWSGREWIVEISKKYKKSCP